jgi:hypothetical protein
MRPDEFRRKAAECHIAAEGCAEAAHRVVFLEMAEIFSRTANRTDNLKRVNLLARAILRQRGRHSLNEDG